MNNDLEEFITLKLLALEIFISILQFIPKERKDQFVFHVNKTFWNSPGNV